MEGEHRSGEKTRTPERGGGGGGRTGGSCLLENVAECCAGEVEILGKKKTCRRRRGWKKAWRNEVDKTQKKAPNPLVMVG